MLQGAASLSPTQLLFVGQTVSEQASHIQAVPAQREEAEGRRAWDSWCAATVQGPSPNSSLPWSSPRLTLPRVLLSLAVLKIPIVPGISFIVSRIWWLHIPLSGFQRTLWSLKNLFSQPPQKQVSSVLQIKEPITEQKESSQLDFPPRKAGLF